MNAEYDLTDIAVLRRLLQSEGFTFSKALGQNFLIDPDVCPHMAELSGARPGVGVLEIGPGVGVLTAELAKLSSRVVSVELDRRLLPVLKKTLAGYDNVKIICGDILKLDIKQLIAEEFAGMPVICCANLPYYITSPVVMALLEEKPGLDAVTVMVQHEAAQRFCAPPGTRLAGAVSYAISYYSHPQVLFEVGRESFLPAPKVDSSVIRLEVRRQPPINCPDEKLLFRLIGAAFQQRRKTLLNALSAGLALPKEQVTQLLFQAGVPQNERGERLTLEDYARLCEVFLAGGYRV